MIDITTIQTFDVPPEIKTLENKNVQLTIENEDLSNKTKIIFGIVILIVVVGGIFVYKFKKDENEKQ